MMADLLAKAAPARPAVLTSGITDGCENQRIASLMVTAILLVFAGGVCAGAVAYDGRASAGDDPCGPRRDLGDLIDEETRAQIELLAGNIRSVLGDFDGPANVRSLNRLFFDELGFVVAGDTGAPQDLTPATVLRRRQGACVGLVVLYVLLSRELGLPISGVSVPGHVFARYSDGRDTINIELLQGGAQLSDQWYIDRYGIPLASIRRGVFLRPLTDAALLGIAHSNLGALYSRVADFENARTHYRAAIALAPNQPGAYYNWGLDLLAQKNPGEAVGKFTVALELHPTDIRALKARGAAYCSAGKHRRARGDFARALELAPDPALPMGSFPDPACAPIRPR